VKKTVVQVDLKDYTSNAATVHSIIGSMGIANLNEAIQSLIAKALKQHNIRREDTLESEAGDGAVFVFDDAKNAHDVGVAIHNQCEVRNSQPDFVNWMFRIGIATSDVTESRGKYGGTAFIRAARLEQGGTPGHVLIDENTFNELDTHIQEAYRPAEQIITKGNKTMTAFRFIAMQDESTIPNSVSQSLNLQLENGELRHSVIGGLVHQVLQNSNVQFDDNCNHRDLITGIKSSDHLFHLLSDDFEDWGLNGWQIFAPVIAALANAMKPDFNSAKTLALLCELIAEETNQKVDWNRVSQTKLYKTSRKDHDELKSVLCDLLSAR